MTEHEKDILFLQLKQYLAKSGYYVGDSEVAEVFASLQIIGTIKI